MQQYTQAKRPASGQRVRRRRNNNERDSPNTFWATSDGKLLSNELLPLGDLNIHNGATLRLSAKLLGGAKKKQSVMDSKLTPEEAMLMEKLKQQEQADMRRKIANDERERLKEQMMTEKRNSRLNLLKIQNQWRKVMRLAKVETLKKDIEVLSQNHERDVDRKEAIIQMLDRDLDEAEDQFQMALKSHLQNIDFLLKLQDQRVQGLETEFMKDLKLLEEEFGTEKEEIMKQHSADMERLYGIMEAIEQEEKERENEAAQEHEQLREEIRNKNLDDINVLRITLDSTIEDLEQKFEQEHLGYLQRTDQRTQDFKYLTAKDQELSKEIEVKVQKIERLQANINHWRTKLQQNTKECSQRNQALEEEREIISKHYHQLKNAMNRYRDQQQKRLTELAYSAQQTKATLKEKVALAENILKLAELARKRETEREKVLPFYANSTKDEDIALVSQDAQIDMQQYQILARNAPQTAADKRLTALQPRGINPKGEEVEEWHYLDNYWKRHNKSQLDLLSIQREKERLSVENQQLKSLLQQYMDGITVNENVMNSHNPLLVVNGKVDLNQRDQSAAAVRPLPFSASRGGGEGGAGNKTSVLEANHLVSTNRVSTQRF